MPSQASGVIRVNIRSWRFAWAVSELGLIRVWGVKLPRIGVALVFYALMRRARPVRQE